MVFDNFFAEMSLKMSSSESAEQMLDAFKIFDSNNDGTITHAILKHTM